LRVVNRRESLDRLHLYDHGLLHYEVNFERGLNRQIAIDDMNWSIRLDTKHTRPQLHNQASLALAFLAFLLLNCRYSLHGVRTGETRETRGTRDGVPSPFSRFSC